MTIGLRRLEKKQLGDIQDDNFVVGSCKLSSNY